MKIVIYCVNYHSYNSLIDYLCSIDKAMAAGENKISLSVFVADNSCPLEPFSYTPTRFSLQIVPTRKNLGYFGAISFLMERYSPLDYDYSIISNVDVLLKEDSL